MSLKLLTIKCAHGRKRVLQPMFIESMYYNDTTAPSDPHTVIIMVSGSVHNVPGSDEDYEKLKNRWMGEVS